MSVVRGTGLANYPQLVTELGGDPARLLRASGIRAADVGDYDAFIPFLAVLHALESAAEATATPDFGRRLAARQGIEVLGPVGVAARTAATVADALSIFSTYLAAYSPAIEIRVTPLNEPGKSFIAFGFRLEHIPPAPQSMELSLGLAVRVLRFLLGSAWSPLSVHIPHAALTPAGDYVTYFGCTAYFAQRTAGFAIRTSDLRRALHRDDVAHRAMVEYLNTIVTPETGLAQSVRAVVRQLLPTGAANMTVVAGQFNVHPKTLQRRLADDGCTFAQLLDDVRKETADRYLRTTGISLSHLARELGYAEQTALTRSCHRWFGCGPVAYRKRLRSASGHARKSTTQSGDRTGAPPPS
ncbi:AraC family transcriptional regulator [Mycolicibacterium llatzerense]|uniref:AraC family transcriptional regulator n=1 Tax=Mycolicibacterium llatzerense TaxID=280871 RepID=UPI0008DDBA1F|nr:AraC family transcriptional regulator [Mycolicibacterium llatzerense]